MTMKLFAQITKVDEAKRLVIGRAVQEVPDLADEIFDYDSSKPHFEEWSKAWADDTDGKSLGNVRAMHGKTAAGKLTAIDFNDADKAIDISAKIVDDNEWAKVQEGVYRGFSIGGSYVGERKAEKIGDREVKRYTAKPIEISIVDTPCIPTAKFFDVVKEDGAVLQKAFKEPEPAAVTTAAPEAVAAPAAAGEGPAVPVVKGSDDQVAEFATLLNEHDVSMGDAIETVKAFIAKRDAPPPAVVEPDAAAVAAQAQATKVREVAEIIAAAMQMGDLNKRVLDPELPFPDLYALAVEHLGDEAIKAMKAANVDALREAIVEKAGARHSKVDAARLQEAHDHLAAMGAQCGDEVEAAAPAGDLAKVAGETLAKMQADLDAANARLAKLEAQPIPARTAALASLTTKSKEEDNATGAAPSDDAAELAKYIVRDPRGNLDGAASMMKFVQATAGRPFAPA